jgi:hypothetical protein
MSCGICGASGHNAATCPHNAHRSHFSSSDPKAKRCECCAQYGYKVYRHHTRGRGDNWDYLDVCLDCHLNCCHVGDFNNLPIKPRVCRIIGKKSYWCR